MLGSTHPRCIIDLFFINSTHARACDRLFPDLGSLDRNQSPDNLILSSASESAENLGGVRTGFFELSSIEGHDFIRTRIDSVEVFLYRDCTVVGSLDRNQSPDNLTLSSESDCREKSTEPAVEFPSYGPCVRTITEKE